MYDDVDGAALLANMAATGVTAAEVEAHWPDG